MSEVFVREPKWRELAQRMERLGVREEDLVERFVLGSGRGGQKRNKTSSCVHLRYPRMGLEARCQRARSRAVNRYLARRELCEKIEQVLWGRHSARQQEAERIRRQKRRRSRRQKARMLEEKRRHGEKKTGRQPVSWADE